MFVVDTKKKKTVSIDLKKKIAIEVIPGIEGRDKTMDRGSIRVAGNFTVYLFVCWDFFFFFTSDNVK